MRSADTNNCVGTEPRPEDRTGEIVSGCVGGIDRDRNGMRLSEADEHQKQLNQTTAQVQGDEKDDENEWMIAGKLANEINKDAAGVVAGRRRYQTQMAR